MGGLIFGLVVCFRRYLIYVFCGWRADVLGCYNIGLVLVGLLRFDGLFGAMFWCVWHCEVAVVVIVGFW